MEISLPNFFILGAPKCGTTSLARWLEAHPQVFVSPIKEPHYHSTDLTNRSIISEAAYRRLYNGVLIAQPSDRGYLQWLSLTRYSNEYNAQNDVNNRCNMWSSYDTFEGLMDGQAVAQPKLGLRLNIAIWFCDSYVPISSGRTRLVWTWREIKEVQLRQWYFKICFYVLCDRK